MLNTYHTCTVDIVSSFFEVHAMFDMWYKWLPLKTFPVMYSTSEHEGDTCFDSLTLLKRIHYSLLY